MLAVVFKRKKYELNKTQLVILNDAIQPKLALKTRMRKWKIETITCTVEQLEAELPWTNDGMGLETYEIYPLCKLNFFAVELQIRLGAS